MKRAAALFVAAVTLSALLAVGPAQAGKPSPYPKPDTFEINAPFAIGRVGLNDDLLGGRTEWNGKARCDIKSSGSSCTWGGEKAQNGFAKMISGGGVNSKLTTIKIQLGSLPNGDAILNPNSPLTRFVTSRGKVSLMSPASKVRQIGPDVDEFGSSGFRLLGKDGAMFFLTLGSPNGKFVTAIILTT